MFIFIVITFYTNNNYCTIVIKDKTTVLASQPISCDMYVYVCLVVQFIVCTLVYYDCCRSFGKLYTHNCMFGRKINIYIYRCCGDNFTRVRNRSYLSPPSNLDLFAENFNLKRKIFFNQRAV